MVNYAGSIGQLAANEMQLDAQQRAALERVAARLVENHARDRQFQQQDRQLNRADAADYQQQSNFNRQMAARELETEMARRERAREFNARQAQVTAAEERQAKYYDWLMKQPQPTDQKQYQSRLNGALMNAQSGKYGSWEEVLNDFPEMQPEDASVVLGQSHAARSQMQDSYNFANNAAGVLNKLSNLKQQLALKNKEVLKRGGFHSPFSASPGFIYSSEKDVAANPGRYDTDIPRLTEEISRLEPIAKHYQEKFGTVITPDPATGQWQPTQSLPWMANRPTATPQPPATTTTQPYEPTATNPQTGERIIFRNGQWQPLR